MFMRVMQASSITLALYILLGLNALQADNTTTTVTKPIEAPEAFVALKQAINRRL
ncbi:MAG: hypothetical protein WA885_08480 [Phormidesmis sp.]